MIIYFIELLVLFYRLHCIKFILLYCTRDHFRCETVIIMTHRINSLYLMYSFCDNLIKFMHNSFILILILAFKSSFEINFPNFLQLSIKYPVRLVIIIFDFISPMMSNNLIRLLLLFCIGTLMISKILIFLLMMKTIIIFILHLFAIFAVFVDLY